VAAVAAAVAAAAAVETSNDDCQERPSNLTTVVKCTFCKYAQYEHATCMPWWHVARLCCSRRQQWKGFLGPDVTAFGPCQTNRVHIALPLLNMMNMAKAKICYSNGCCATSVGRSCTWFAGHWQRYRFTANDQQKRCSIVP
jgi:hypothetical protein